MLALMLLSTALALPPIEPPQCNLPGWIAPVRKQPCNLCDSCECLYCACPAVAKPAPAIKAPEKPATKSVVFHQYSREHTHSCPNPNCSFRKYFGEPFTWNHAMDRGSHICAYCKTKQVVVSNRPVTLVREVSTDASVPPARTTTATRAAWSSTASAVMAVSSGCSNGQCSTITRWR